MLPLARHHRTRLAAIALAALFIFGSLLPSMRAVYKRKHGRDYATYHYAVQAAWTGADPYDTAGLGELAREEGLRTSVHPYFYPPPFVLGMAWAAPFSLPTAYRVWFWANQAFLLGSLWVLWRWIRASPLLLLAIAATFTPIPDNAKMGQANIAVMFLALVGLWRGWGTAVGAAAMAKMSPALYLAGWVRKRQWRPVLAAAGTALALSVVALVAVDMPTQLRFYTEILPGFSTGDYHGLKVPMTLPANHSVPDLFNQLWPGPDGHTLSPAAALGSKLVTLGLLGGVLALARTSRDALGDACLFAAITVVMVIAPVYTYEHHLSMLLLPAVVAFTALLRGRLSPRWWPVVVLSYFFVAWPLYWLRPTQKAIPALHWWLQESKFFGELGLLIACAWAARFKAPAEKPA